MNVEMSVLVGSRVTMLQDQELTVTSQLVILGQRYIINEVIPAPIVLHIKAERDSHAMCEALNMQIETRM